MRRISTIRLVEELIITSTIDTTIYVENLLKARSKNH
jgi:hypothetical protein